MWDPAYIACFVVLLCFGLVILGLYRYKAHREKWIVPLSKWGLSSALTVGMALRTRSLMLPLAFAISFLLAFWLWRLLRNRLAGWPLHFMRGVILSLVVGPFFMVRVKVLLDFGHYRELMYRADFSEGLWFLISNLPGLVLVGLVAVLCSHQFSKPKDKSAEAVGWKSVSLIVALLLILANWYAVGSIDIHQAASAGRLGILRYALWSRPGIANACDNQSWSLLHHAAHHGHAEIAESLIRFGAEVNKQNSPDDGGWTPLHCAMNKGNVSVAGILIDAGADVNATTGRHTQGYREWTALHFASDVGNTELVKSLLQNGAYTEAKDYYGNTPLHIATNAPVAQLLLSIGSSVNARNAADQTPLHTGVYWRHAGVALALLEKGADVNAIDKHGNTPLIYAALNRDAVICRMLVEAGGDSDRLNEQGQSAMTIANHNADTTLVHILRKHGSPKE